MNLSAFRLLRALAEAQPRVDEELHDPSFGTTNSISLLDRACGYSPFHTTPIAADLSFQISNQSFAYLYANFFCS